MRVIGLFTGWNCKEWVNASIENHLKLVTELHVMIAAHNAEFAKTNDGTGHEAMKTWSRDARVKFHVPTVGITASCDRTKCALLNQMLLSAAPEPDDIVMICDSDEFFDNAAIAEIKDKYDGFKWDSLLFYARYFVINMHWFMEQDGLQRVFRVRKVEGWRKDVFHFKPTQKPIPRPIDKQILLKKHPLFHYSLLSPLAYKRIHWTTENGVDPTKLEWLNNIYAKWNPEDHDLCRRLVAENPTRGKGCFYVNNDMGAPKEPPYMYRYNGPHPDEICKLGLDTKGDFR